VLAPSAQAATGGIPQGRIVDQELTIWASVGRVIARARSVDDTWNRET
jgi:hypothetical protein